MALQDGELVAQDEDVCGFCAFSRRDNRSQVITWNDEEEDEPQAHDR